MTETQVTQWRMETCLFDSNGRGRVKVDQHKLCKLRMMDAQVLSLEEIANGAGHTERIVTITGVCARGVCWTQVERTKVNTIKGQGKETVGKSLTFVPLRERHRKRT